MKAEVNSLVRSGNPTSKPPVYPHPAASMKTLEPRKPPFRHLSRMQSPATNEIREIGLTLHEILAVADIMREAYGNGDMENKTPHGSHGRKCYGCQPSGDGKYFYGIVHKGG